MQALLISSSPHKERSRTFLLAKETLRSLGEEGVSCETLHLDDFKVSFCKHCQSCHKKILNCLINDDVAVILQKMLKADAIILASPNYINQVNALMKTLMDRSAHFIHCKRLAGKYFAGIVTSGSGQNQEVLDYIRYYGAVCGAQYSGGVSAQEQFGQEKKEETFELGRKIAEDLRQKRLYAQQLQGIEKNKQHFAQVIRSRKDEWQEEYNYWQQKGWL
jgi:multimeric flavodoxin WrbA